MRKGMQKFVLALFAFLPVLILPHFAFTAPNVSVVIAKDKIQVNQVFDLELHISWTGDADDYIVVPPVLTLPEDVVQKETSFSSLVAGDQYNLLYHYKLSAQKQGTFILDPIEIKYWGQGDEKQRVLETEKISFTTVSFTVAGLDMVWFLTIIIILVLGTIVAGVLIKDRRVRKRGSSTKKSMPYSKEKLWQKLQQCKQSKLQGDPVSFYRYANEIINEISGDDKRFEDLGKTLEQVRFGGYRPTSEELDRVYRYLVKKIESSFPKEKNKELANY